MFTSQFTRDTNRNATYKYIPSMPNNKYINIFHIQLY